MNKKKLIENVTKILQTDKNITSDTILTEFDEWDSLAMISVIAMLDAAGQKITIDELRNIKTIEDLLRLAKIDE